MEHSEHKKAVSLFATEGYLRLFIFFFWKKQVI